MKLTPKLESVVALSMIFWLTALLAAATTFLPAAAAADCRPAGNIGPGLRKLIQAFQTADKTGHAVLAVQDFLVGVTDIEPGAQALLNRRGAVAVTKTGLGQGSVLNIGQSSLSFEGMFAQDQTYFIVPQNLKARFVSKTNSLILYYNDDNRLHLGEAIIGIPVYHSVNHVAITPDKLQFFWGDNTSDDADRCYAPS